MNIFFDLDHIFNKEYPENPKGLEKLSVDCKKESDCFSNRINLIWNYVSYFYADKSNLILNLSDETFKKHLTNEISLRLFNTLSILTSKELLGADKFLENTRLGDQTRRLTYTDKKTFNSFIKHLIPTSEKEYFVTSLPGESISFSEALSFKSSNLILDNTPLSEFIYTHFIYKDSNKYFESLLTEASRKNTKVKLFFKEEGRYFLSVLLLAAASKNIPYTTNTLYGISLHSINNLFDTLYYAYHQEQLTADKEEKFLFLINTECIFQFSLLNNIFYTLADYVNTFKSNSLPVFISSMPFIMFLSSYPLNVVKIKLWNTISKDNFSFISKAISDTGSNILELTIYQDYLSQAEDINDMVDLFIYILFYIEGFSFDNPDPQIFRTIKSNIFEYLSKSEAQSMEWSLLSSKEKKYPKIPSIFNEYFNFYILYYIYNIGSNHTDPNWTNKDLECSFSWPGYNHYVKYLLNHKK